MHSASAPHDTDGDADTNTAVVVGPDLNSTRSEMDRKLYRHVTLGNGLRCVLICDTVALRQRRLGAAGGGRGCRDSDSDDDDTGSIGDDGGSSVDEDDDDDDDGEEVDDDGLRKAATALLVNVGSYHDPPRLQGLSHFLEHMLFLGTETHPGANDYDAFLSKCGGDDNAYTDMEHTLYHYCVPQGGGGGGREEDGENDGDNVWRAMEMFAAFFKCPLLSGDSAERELNAIESEFELNRKDDGCRWTQLMSHTCGMSDGRSDSGKGVGGGVGVGDGVGGGGGEEGKPFHPFAKFPWGNMDSLRTEPESSGVDIIKELRDYYNAHYYARNMRLVVLAGYDLDEMQRRVVKYFGDVPANPRVEDGAGFDGNGSGADGGGTVTNLRSHGLPFRPSSLAKLYRIVPVRNHHTLSLTFQIPPTCAQWRTKPADYLSHLIGHEASGSVLSALKERGWAMGLSAGTGEDGVGDASTHALFTVDVSLSKRGMKCWEGVIGIIFTYVGMLRYYFLEGHDDADGKLKEGLAPWIYDELKSIAELSYRYADEGDVTDIVEEVAESMAPWCNLPDERILDGESLLFDDSVDNEMVKRLLFDYLTPENMRVDLMSSFFGRDGDYNDSTLVEGEEKKEDESVTDDETGQQMDVDLGCANADGDDDYSPDGLFDREKAGSPSIEPRFGTRFWVENISKETMETWRDAAHPRLPSSEVSLGLPQENPYIPSKFDLKPLPAEDAHHPLINCSVKVQVSVGKKKSWFPAAVTKYRMKNDVHQLSLSYEDEGEKWHMLDTPEAYTKFEGGDGMLEVGHGGSFDGGKVKFRITAVPREGEGIVFNFGDSGHDDDVEDGLAFPAIPPSAPVSRLPLLVHDKDSFRLWHLQDRKFKRPLADLRIRFECEGMNDSAINQACMALFCKLCNDALTETCYLASIAELGSSIYSTDTGFSVRVHGFDHNLLSLAKVVLDVAMSFRGRDVDDSLPSTIKQQRFDACLENLQRRYTNSGMNASSFSASLRLLCIRPGVKSSFSQLKALKGLTTSKFVQVMNNLLKRVAVEVLYHGNVNRKDADDAVNMITSALTEHHVALPKKKLPTRLVSKVKHSIDHHQIVAPTIDQKDPNTAVEVYFQFAKDDNSDSSICNRVIVDLLESILEEPLYNQLRTKEAFGYEVSCGARWTYGILGMSFRVVTACKSAEEVSTRIDQFLESYRADLECMDEETYMEHVVGLAKNKLESFDSMEDETGAHWSEIIEGRYDFEAYRKEVLSLRTLSKDQLLGAYDEWLNPLCKSKPNKRRRIVLHVIGAGDDAASSGRPVIGNNEIVGDVIDALVDEFHNKLKHASWGRVF